ncbi:O-antigen ligase family protein [Tautonia marina]|uniref:O-antigen ligase family protein n=1 Tax=Tautonia marina TaxID=2653855 RepID=UPI001260470E|nr:O-antigen ligase family protein [Tautonia marina]
MTPPMAGRSGKTRKRSKTPPDTLRPSAAVPDDASRFGEHLRRLALGLTAALVVARAYWPSEGTTEIETGAQLSWTFALLAVAALAVVGAMMERTLRFRFVWADLAILALIASVGVSASGALDRRVAINLAWQWVGVGFVYVLFRSLPRTRDESRSLAGVLAATAAAVSAYALYQVGVELPAFRAQFEQNPARMLAMLGINAAPGSPEYEQFVNRVLFSREPYATFALANSLAGYIVGPLVLGIGLLMVGIGNRGRQGDSPSTQRPPLLSLLMAALPVLAILVVLLLTKSRSAFAGLVVGVAILAVWMAPRLGRRTVIGGTLGLIVVGILASVGLWQLGLLDWEVITQSTLSLRYRVEYWIGTWRVLTDGNTWLTGLGPGNFRPEYRVHKLVEASEDIVDPHNLILEVWATAGLFAVICLGLGLALVLWNLFGPARSESPAKLPSKDPVGSEPNPVGLQGPRSILLWAGLGGWIGVLLLGDLVIFSDDNEGLIRWLILGFGWGLAVALAGPLWSRVSIPPVAFAAAILATVVNLLAAGGIGYAPIASMLWGLAALGLNLREDRPAGRLRELPGLFFPFTAAAVLAAILGTFYGTVSPYWRSQTLMNQADALLAQRPTAPRQEDLDQVGDLLDRAIAADLYASRPYLALAELELIAWLGRGAPPEDAVWNRIERLLEAARTPPRDPRSLDARMARINSARRILQARPDLPLAARDRLRAIIADASYTIATDLSPTRPIDRARAAEALAAVGQFDRAVDQAEIALDLDARVPHLDKKLPEATRERLIASIPSWRSPEDAESPEPLDESGGSAP